MLQQKHDEFNALKNDVEKWKWIKANQNLGITVFCDNDDTFAQFDDDDSDDPKTLDFRDYIGWSDGIFHLLEAVGIKAESV